MYSHKIHRCADSPVNNTGGTIILNDGYAYIRVVAV